MFYLHYYRAIRRWRNQYGTIIEGTLQQCTAKKEQLEKIYSETTTFWISEKSEEEEFRNAKDESNSPENINFNRKMFGVNQE